MATLGPYVLVHLLRRGDECVRALHSFWHATLPLYRFSQLVIDRKATQLNEAKVERYYTQKLQLKSFFSMLKFLEQKRE